MENKFTLELLLMKYLYHETSLHENDVVEEALSNNWKLQELCDELEAGYRTLPKVKFAPKRSTIQRILNYSAKQSAIEPYV